MEPEHKSSYFSHFARTISAITGRPMTFLLAVLVIVVWGVTGPIFGFSDTWQLVINTGTTIVTFLMVFLIQNTQNRDTDALQIKLDELIRAVRGAQDALLDLEELDDEALERVRAQYVALAERARAAARGRIDPTLPAEDPGFPPRPRRRRGSGEGRRRAR